ncbi:MAG: hypothetical protein ABL971_06485 [Vicinamibacterales bacterium]
MPKSAVSVTLDVDNLLWLRARAAQRKRRSLSDTLDEVVTAARTGGLGAGPIRSVVGTISCSDEDLQAADAYVKALFQDSANRPLEVHEPRAVYGPPRRRASVSRGAGKGQSRRG